MLFDQYFEIIYRIAIPGKESLFRWNDTVHTTVETRGDKQRWDGLGYIVKDRNADNIYIYIYTQGNSHFSLMNERAHVFVGNA